MQTFKTFKWEGQGVAVIVNKHSELWCSNTQLTVKQKGFQVNCSNSSSYSATRQTPDMKENPSVTFIHEGIGVCVCFLYMPKALTLFKNSNTANSSEAPI